MPPPIDPGYTSPTQLEPIEASVYILRAGFSVATPDAREGMGFIIGEQHILTCAHVVASALGASGDLRGRKVSFSYSPLNQRSDVVEATVEGYWPRDDSARKGDPPSDVALLRLNDAGWKHPDDSIIAPWGEGVVYDMVVRGYGISDAVRSGRDFQGPVSGEGAGMRWRISSHADPNRKIVPGCSGGAVWIGSRVIGMVTSFQQEEVGLFIPTEHLLAQPEIKAVWTDGGGTVAPQAIGAAPRNSIAETEAEWRAKTLRAKVQALLHRCDREDVVTDIDAFMGGKQRTRPVIGLVAARNDDIFSLLFDRLRFDFDDEFRGADALQTPAYRSPPADPWNLPWRRAPEPSAVRLPAMQRALATKLTGIDSAQDASEKLAHGPSRVFFSELDRSKLDKEDTVLLRDWSSYWKTIGARVARAPAHLVCVLVADDADPADTYAVLQDLMAEADTEVVANLGLLTDLTSDHLRKWTERIAEPIGFPDPTPLREHAIWAIQPPLRMRKVEEWVANINDADFQ